MAGVSHAVDRVAVSRTGHRRYAVRQVIFRAQWIFAGVLIFTWVIGITEHASLPFLAVAALGTAVAVWQGGAQLRTGGVSETADGIANRTTCGYRRWRWDEIDHFAHVGPRVHLVTRDHQACPLAGINEGWRNIKAPNTPVGTRGSRLVPVIEDLRGASWVRPADLVSSVVPDLDVDDGRAGCVDSPEAG